MYRGIFFAEPNQIDPDSYVIAKYYVESNLGVPRAGEQIAIEESIGTWTKIRTGPSVEKRLSAKVFKWTDGKKGFVWIAFPVELFEAGNLPQFLSVIAGNLFGLKVLENVRLLDVDIPKCLIEDLKGPKFGIDGVRKIVGTLESGRPHLGTIFKPKVGLSPKEMGEKAYFAGKSGIDFCKDDETLTNQRFCPIEERVSRVMEKLNLVKEETNRTVLYAVNVTTDPQRILDRADIALENGANMLMVDIITAGLSALKALSEDEGIKVPIHAHRSMHAAMTRNEKHGIHPKLIAILARLAGSDQFHVGTVVGKMAGNKDEVLPAKYTLTEKMHGLKRTFPVSSGGMHPGLIPDLIKIMGRDIVITAGGGIWGHPDGGAAGVRAMRQAIDATLKDIPLEEYASSHPELKTALKKWVK